MSSCPRCNEYTTDNKHKNGLNICDDILQELNDSGLIVEDVPDDTKV